MDWAAPLSPSLNKYVVVDFCRIEARVLAQVLDPSVGRRVLTHYSIHVSCLLYSMLTWSKD
jgi:hypothetical protein